jgi:hypothetical protein
MPKRGTEDTDGINFSNAEIMTVLTEIRAHRAPPKDRVRVFRRKYPEFADRHPRLFEMACDDAFDMGRLEAMLGLRARVDTSEMTAENASKLVGQALFNQYVQPLVDAEKEAGKKV